MCNAVVRLLPYQMLGESNKLDAKVMYTFFFFKNVKSQHTENGTPPSLQNFFSFI